MFDKSVLIGIFLPFLGTTLGSATIFLFKDKISDKVQKAFMGFAGGVMIAASVWSLLIPSMEMASKTYQKFTWIPAAFGFLLGVLFLLLLDTITPHLHALAEKPEGLSKHTSKLPKSIMLFLAVTLHNIPEGMAVGVTFAGFLAESEILTLAGAMSLAIGIALQNFPEGAVVSLPLKSSGLSKGKSFLLGTISGIVEPIASIITILLASFVEPFLPWFLSFAAGAMMYVVVEELIPDSQKGTHSNIGTISCSLGFVIMMILDSLG